MTCGNKVVIHDPAARRVVQTPGRTNVVVRAPTPVVITPSDREKVVVHDPVTDLTVTKPVVRQVTIEAEGPQGPPGAAGSGDLHYVHIQALPSATWVVVHNLGKYPAVSVVDSADELVEGDVRYDSLNQLTLTYVGAFSGKAFCN